MQPHKNNNYLYNKNLQPYANELRKSMTKAEAWLWKYILRARGLKGYQFRRQRPVLTYIADFFCKELSLIIEVDGITHSDEVISIHDKQRQHELERAGFTILRFTDEEVLHGIEGVKEILENWISSHERKCPPLAGGGGGI
jgi:very-short-patch-repair endonuclease